MEYTLVHIAFFLTNIRKILKEHLEHLDYTVGPIIDLKKLCNGKYNKYLKKITYLVLYRIRGVF